MRPIQPSTSLRRHMHGLDFCQAVHDATDDYPELLKARRVLARLIVRTSTHVGPKDDDGHWVFASEDHRQQYGRKLHDVVELTKTQGPETQDGYVWFILALGWGEDCFDFAAEGQKFGLAHCWRLILRVLGWMYERYEAYEGRDTYAHGKQFLADMGKVTEAWA